MIRFSAALVVAGLGLLVAGAVTSELPLIYAAIASELAAALVLATGVFASRSEIFGRHAWPEEERARAPGESGQPGKALALHPGAIPLSRTAEDSETPRRSGDRRRDGDHEEAPAGSPARSGEGSGLPLPARASRSGLGWPASGSPADELWARVDAELAAAGAAASAPRLTANSSSEDVWDRVQLELATAGRWNPALNSNVSELHAPARIRADVDVTAEEEAEAAAAPEPAAGTAGSPGECWPASAAAAPGIARPGIVPPDDQKPSPGAQTASPEVDAEPPQAQAGSPEAPAASPEAQLAPPEAPAASPETQAVPPEPQAAPPEAPAASPETQAVPPQTQPVPPQTQPVPPGAQAVPPGAQAASPPAQVQPPEAPAVVPSPRAASPADQTAGRDAPATAAAGRPDAGKPAQSGPKVGPGQVAVVPGVPRYHQNGCILIRFLGQGDVDLVTAEEAELSGCVPCRACHPDDGATRDG